MSAHTPGPWIIDESPAGNDDEPITISAEDPKDDQMFVLASIWGEDCDEEETPMTRANAKLIAAAPDLLAELIAEDAMLSNLLGDITAGRPLNGPRMEIGLRSRREALRTAIAKATQP